VRDKEEKRKNDRRNDPFRKSEKKPTTARAEMNYCANLRRKKKREIIVYLFEGKKTQMGQVRGRLRGTSMNLSRSTWHLLHRGSLKRRGKRLRGKRKTGSAPLVQEPDAFLNMSDPRVRIAEKENTKDPRTRN